MLHGPATKGCSAKPQALHDSLRLSHMLSHKIADNSNLVSDPDDGSRAHVAQANMNECEAIGSFLQNMLYGREGDRDSSADHATRLRATIKALLLDSKFQELVAQVEEAWDELDEDTLEA
ncbi:hypothetical protein CEUSTIGMA_g9659.t1 [Chlamydomonas eustigma]|uniref:Uncharacterized protein n=1 Tax=Chlamydomonas eustigma TaxID=1157962 RepID=A0A250XGM4_9CHLO|nr:hypothetical protein CEUSTIGMA_g9659.t1 [Chlamydomonas eustigma]|eukprot:GAX82231.1 hypothetical protein CEUSTIGMA_g9659.t1 [Chlamydomonas eustigma]